MAWSSRILSIFSSLFGQLVGGHSGVGSLSTEGIGLKGSLGITAGSLYSTRSEMLKVELMPMSGSNSSTWALCPTLLIILNGPAPWAWSFFTVPGGNHYGLSLIITKSLAKNSLALFRELAKFLYSSLLRFIFWLIFLCSCLTCCAKDSTDLETRACEG